MYCIDIIDVSGKQTVPCRPAGSLVQHKGQTNLLLKKLLKMILKLNYNMLARALQCVPSIFVLPRRLVCAAAMAEFWAMLPHAGHASLGLPENCGIPISGFGWGAIM